MRNIRRILSVVLLMCLCAGPAAAETAEDPASVTTLDFGARYVDIGYVISEIEKYPNLERVDMYGTPVGIGNTGKLSEMFPDIIFGWTLRFREHSVRSDVVVFSTQHSYSSKRHIAKQLALLRFCRQLRALDIGHNNCDDLWFVSGLEDLRVLVVADNRITDVSPLSGLSGLEYLDLSGNRIRDIAPLAGLTRLMDLNLSDNSIEDLEPLKKMTWLKRLWLHRAAGNASGDLLSDEKIQALKEALPDTEIICSGRADSWQAHPHFDVIQKMFRGNKEYIPFEDSYAEE